MPRLRKKVSVKKTKLVRDDRGREVIYPEIKSGLCVADRAITADQARSILGWEENDKFKEYLLTYKAEGKTRKVQCLNNINNRPLYRGVYETLMQEQLNKRWRLNGEPIIIGNTGLVLNGQHQLVALVLAAQKWRENPDKYADWWQTEPTIDKVVVYGVKEDDDTVNTMDTCKPRSLADVIYRSEYFAGMKRKDRKVISRITEHAIRLVWHRTGASLNAFAPRKTHAESIDFLNRHETLLRLVKHIYEEDGEAEYISRYLTPGYAAGVAYLMACAATDLDAEDGYSSVEKPSESNIDFRLLDNSEHFFVLLAAIDNKTLHPLRSAFEQFEAPPTREEKLALLVKGWNLWSTGTRLTKTNLGLSYETNEDGQLVLAECPVVGGVDLGNPKQ